MSDLSNNCNSALSKITTFKTLTQPQSVSFLNAVSSFVQVLKGEDCDSNPKAKDDLENPVDNGYWEMISNFFKCIKVNNYKSFECAKEYIGLDSSIKPMDFESDN